MLQKMIIKDKIYGSHLITEPVLIDLLKAKSVLRLKKISQFGIPDEYYPIKNFSRYDHSLGVMILIKALGGSTEEQVAGLLHDISHSAFSHVIDWVVSETYNESLDETYQDNQHKDLVTSGEIKVILQKHHYHPERIADYHNFKLLERDIPNLCADRVDYALREFPVNLAKSLFKNLVNFNNKIVFADEKSALTFATNFLKLQNEHWGGFEAVSRFKLFSGVLKLAILEGTIKFSDFLKDDQYVIRKLLKTKNPEILAVLEILKNKKLPTSSKSEIIHKKFRYTDPEFQNKGKVQNLSLVNLKFKKFLEKQRTANQKGIKVPVFRINQ
jgi:hypothetical protein